MNFWKGSKRPLTPTSTPQNCPYLWESCACIAYYLAIIPPRIYALCDHIIKKLQNNFPKMMGGGDEGRLEYVRFGSATAATNISRLLATWWACNRWISTWGLFQSENYLRRALLAGLGRSKRGERSGHSSVFITCNSSLSGGVSVLGELGEWWSNMFSGGQT